MSALDNVLVGMHTPAEGARRSGRCCGSPGVVREERRARERARELLEFVGLPDVAETWAQEPAVRRPAPPGDRPGAGDRADAAAARRADRRDEPAGDGALTDLISRLRAELGLTVFLIEHDMGW